jgi:hypothetical protein
MKTTWVDLRMSLTEAEIEARARELCESEGIDPNTSIRHSYGDDFTPDEWTRFQPQGGMYDLKVSPWWRLYRSRAAIELCRQYKDVLSHGDNVVPFRRRR